MLLPVVASATPMIGPQIAARIKKLKNRSKKRAFRGYFAIPYLTGTPIDDNLQILMALALSECGKGLAIMFSKSQNIELDEP